jgi:hypothetical protein
MSTRVERPKNLQFNGNLWAEEELFGHRLYDDQTAELIILEFLAVFADRHRHGIALRDPVSAEDHEWFEYRVPKRASLRRLVFNDPGQDAADFEEWRRRATPSLEADVELERVEHTFTSFAHYRGLTQLLRESAVQPETKKNWSIKFVFPHGPDAIYPELDDRLQSSRRFFFARGGELLYLMLNRSAVDGADLAAAIARRLLHPEDRWNRIVRALQHDRNPQAHNDFPVGYLPYLHLERYDRLAEDWGQLLRLKLPSAGLFEPLAKITALHLALYMIERSNAALAKAEAAFLLTEIAGPKPDIVRRLSIQCFDHLRNLPLEAVRQHVRGLHDHPDWQAAREEPDPAGPCRSFLEGRPYHLKVNEALKKIAVSPNTPGGLAQLLERYAEYRHGQHWKDVLLTLLRGAGLLVRRPGIGTWLAPSDGLLRALVMARVDGEMALEDFLVDLYRHYGLVIAEAEAVDAYGYRPCDRTPLVHNVSRLEERMRALGLLTRLSDACAYVVNPFVSARD